MKTKVYLVQNKDDVIAASMDENHAFALCEQINGDAGIFGDAYVTILPLDEYAQNRNYVVHYEFSMKPKISLNIEALYGYTAERVTTMCRHNYLVYVTAPDEYTAKLKADKLLAEYKLTEVGYA